MPESANASGEGGGRLPASAPPEPASKKRRLWENLKKTPNRIKRGVGIGILAGALTAGYEGNVKTAVQSSRTGLQEAAALIEKERDRRSLWGKVTGEKPPAKIPVGERWATQRGPNRELVSIGKKDVYAGARKYMNWTPTIPLNKTGAKRALQLGLVGAAAGAAFPLLKRGGKAAWDAVRRKRREAPKVQRHRL